MLLSDNGNLTLTGFENQEACVHFIGMHEKEFEPFIKGYFQVPIDAPFKLIEAKCEKNSI